MYIFVFKDCTFNMFLIHGHNQYELLSRSCPLKPHVHYCLCCLLEPYLGVPLITKLFLN